MIITSGNVCIISNRKVKELCVQNKHLCEHMKSGHCIHQHDLCVMNCEQVLALPMEPCSDSCEKDLADCKEEIKGSCLDALSDCVQNCAYTTDSFCVANCKKADEDCVFAAASECESQDSFPSLDCFHDKENECLRFLEQCEIDCKDLSGTNADSYCIGNCKKADEDCVFAATSECGSQDSFPDPNCLHSKEEECTYFFEKCQTGCKDL